MPLTRVEQEYDVVLVEGAGGLMVPAYQGAADGGLRCGKRVAADTGNIGQTRFNKSHVTLSGGRGEPGYEDCRSNIQ